MSTISLAMMDLNRVDEAVYQLWSNQGLFRRDGNHLIWCGKGSEGGGQPKVKINGVTYSAKRILFRANPDELIESTCRISLCCNPQHQQVRVLCHDAPGAGPDGSPRMPPSNWITPSQPAAEKRQVTSTGIRSRQNFAAINSWSAAGMLEKRGRCLIWRGSNNPGDTRQRIAVNAAPWESVAVTCSEPSCLNPRHLRPKAN